MKSRRYVVFCSLVALVVGASVGTATVSAGGAGDNGSSSAAEVSKKKKKKIQRGPRGKRGPAGPPGPAGAPGAPGAPGVGLNFNRQLAPNGLSSITVGKFEISAAATSGGGCEPIKIVGTKQYFLSVGPAGPFTGVAEGAAANVQSGGNSQMFTAVSSDGSSTMSGIVGAFSFGNRCLVSGYVTGV